MNACGPWSVLRFGLGLISSSHLAARADVGVATLYYVLIDRICSQYTPQLPGVEL
jgi:hypothetical protein